MVDGLRDDVCSVCGAEGADILCPKCGQIVCSECFDEETRNCLDCAEAEVEGKVRKKAITLVGGSLMIIVGLSVAAAGIVAGLPAEGITVVFPFIVGDVSPWVAGLYSFLFFVTVATASLLPWYIHTRTEQNYAENDDLTVMEGNLPGGESFEHIEYVITAELPKRLEKTVLVETSGTSIHLHSSLDKEFNRRYPIPEGHDLEGLDYDYEEGYLVLRLHLIRVP